MRTAGTPDLEGQTVEARPDRWIDRSIARSVQVMVTHNPDLECYADRILYVKDGRFERQELNAVQMKLDFEEYRAHIHSQQASY